MKLKKKDKQKKKGEDSKKYKIMASFRIVLLTGLKWYAVSRQCRRNLTFHFWGGG